MDRLKNILFLWMILLFVNFIFNDLTLNSAFSSLIYSVIIAFISEIIVSILTSKNRQK